MIAHGCAVTQAASHACVVVDEPFGSCVESPSLVFRSAARIIAETGCTAVKLKSEAVMAGTIHFLNGRGVRVIEHVGLTPQSVNTLGGYPVRGRTEPRPARS